MPRRKFSRGFIGKKIEDSSPTQFLINSSRTEPPVPHNVMIRAGVIRAHLTSGKHWRELDGNLINNKRNVIFRLPSFYKLIGKLDENGDVVGLVLGRRDEKGKFIKEARISLEKPIRMN